MCADYCVYKWWSYKQNKSLYSDTGAIKSEIVLLPTKTDFHEARIIKAK